VIIQSVAQLYISELSRLMSCAFNLPDYIPPAPMAALSKARIVFDRSNTGITVSNSARVMEVCSRFSVFCCPV
jgi:hypothetical protein